LLESGLGQVAGRSDNLSGVLARGIDTQIAAIAPTTVPKPAANARPPAMRVCQ
jgi:hypothetical protein